MWHQSFPLFDTYLAVGVNNSCWVACEVLNISQQSQVEDNFIKFELNSQLATRSAH